MRIYVRQNEIRLMQQQRGGMVSAAISAQPLPGFVAFDISNLAPEAPLTAVATEEEQQMKLPLDQGTLSEGHAG